MDLLTIVYAFIGAVIYAGSFYLKNRQADEDFDPVKFASTLIVGLIVGCVSYVTGSPITEQTVYEQLIAYAGITVLVETWIKALVRGFKK